MNVSELKKKVSRLSDEELRTLILALASSSGVEPSKVKKLTDDIPRTRRTIMLLSEKQIDALLSSLGRNGNDLISRLGSDLT